MTRAPLVCALALLVACAALSRREKVELAEDRLSRARALDAPRLAAASYARFDAALSAARGLAEEAPEREEHMSEARLWLEAAIAEAETAALARERLAIERETLRHDEAYLAAERARFALEDARERQLAAQIAGEEAARALARAAGSPALRVRLDSEETRRAARSLLARAELIALSLGSQVAGRAPLLAELEAAQKLVAKAPDDALKRADQALLSALALVGTLRDPAQAPSAEQKASLAEALSLLGARVARSEHGLTAALASPLPALGLARLCRVARDYPHGAVQVLLDARKAPKDSVPALLAKHGCEGGRFGVVLRPGEAHVTLTFLAY